MVLLKIVIDVFMHTTFHKFTTIAEKRDRSVITRLRMTVGKFR